MGRELKRKQAKREGKNVREVQKINKEKPLSPKTFWIIMVVLLVFFVLLYILTGIFVTKEIKWFNKNTDEEQITEIDSSAARMGFVIAQGENAEQAVSRCENALKLIHVEMG